jgi:hypothetical protein
MDQRQIVRMIAAGRVALGVKALVAPRGLAALAFGGGPHSGAMVMAVRMLGARDLVLGLGTLRALDRDEDPATWAKASAAADAVDAVAATLAPRAIGLPRTAFTLAAAGISAAAGTRASTRLA